MCGIVGTAGSMDLSSRNVFTQMLLCDVLRGSSATGLAAINTRPIQPSVTTFRNNIPSYDLLDSKNYDKVVCMGPTISIGHNRAPTHGANRRENAHPFTHGDICGVHNGTVDWSAKQRMLDHHRFDTDSEAIFYNMNLEGVPDTINKLTGAWSLVWFDCVAKTINFLRNKERPMFIVFSEDKKQMFWSSEVGLVLWVMARNGIKADKAQMTTEDTHYAWTIPDLNEEFQDPTRQRVLGMEIPEKINSNYDDYLMGTPGKWVAGKWEPLPREEGEQRLPFKPPTHVTVTPSQALLRARQNELDKSSKTLLLPGVVGDPVTPSTEATNVISINAKSLTKMQEKQKRGKWRPPYHDHRGYTIGRAKFEAMISGGCVYCSHEATWGEACLFLPPAENNGGHYFLCEECLLDDEKILIAKGA